MKVLHIITGLGDGGAESVLFRLTSYSQANDNVIISLSSQGKYGPLFKDKGIKVIALSIGSEANLLAGFLKLVKLIRTEKPDIVQTWMYHADFFGGLAAVLAGKRNCLFWNIRHSDLSIKANGVRLVLLAKLLAFLSHFLPQVVFCCSHVAKESHQSIGYDKDKIHIISNGFNTQKFTPSHKSKAHSRTALGIPSTAFVIGMVARFNIQKNHETLVSAFQLVRNEFNNVHLLLVGSGNEERQQKVELMIADSKLQNQVTFIPREDDIVKIYRLIDLHVLSSSFGEGFPNVLGEAMACGVPCVATDVGDSKIIIGETGWITPPRDVISFASNVLEAITEFYDKPLQWGQRKKACRQRVINYFEIDHMYRSYQHNWQSIVKR